MRTERYAPENPGMILVGTKCDLDAQNKRMVTTEQGLVYKINVIIFANV